MEISITGVAATEAMLLRLSLLDSIVQAWFAAGEHDAIMQESFQQNFNAGGRPHWEPLAQETVDIRERLGFPGSEPILVRTGNFMDEITSMESVTRHEVGASVAEWGIEQLRGDEKAKFTAHMTGNAGRAGNIPIRKPIGFQQEDTQKLIDSLGNFIERNFL